MLHSLVACRTQRSPIAIAGASEAASRAFAPDRTRHAADQKRCPGANRISAGRSARAADLLRRSPDRGDHRRITGPGTPASGWVVAEEALEDYHVRHDKSAVAAGSIFAAAALRIGPVHRQRRLPTTCGAMPRTSPFRCAPSTAVHHCLGRTAAKRNLNRG